MKIFHRKTSTTDISVANEKELRKIYLSVFEPYSFKKKMDSNTLSYMMNLFEEKGKHEPLPVGYPLPIKANGAIVVHRPSDFSSPLGCSPSLPLYLQDIDSDDKHMFDHTILDQDKQLQDGNDKRKPTFEETELLDLVHEENNQLRRQVLLEREQNEKWRISKERYQQELACAEQTIRTLKRTADRFENLLSSSEKEQHRQPRRQSTGSALYTAMIRGTSFNTMASSYERKLQILLNEIEAMEQQELALVKQIAQKSNECDRLYRKMNCKDDVIRQLAYNLQIEQHVTRHR
ncbi:hypothetical protein BD560DRAFT_381440 [Blakeslea trispora]|nr:hypothetical protein BD560DRAFT_381440 [Blakeslea trispora]